jgi:hypothetical protein
MMGPVYGKVSDAVTMARSVMPTEEEQAEVGFKRWKVAERNIPMANLFYIKPAMDHAWFWNMREMLSPGSLRRSERAAERRGERWRVRPSEIVPLPVGERLAESLNPTQ